MTYIESHDSLREHPKTRRAARALGVNRAQFIGHLHMLWWWAMEYADDGDLSVFDPADIADGADWDGDPDQFVDALLNAGPGDSTGFLAYTPEHRLVIHDWNDYAGKLIERRRANRERMRSKRAEHVQDTCDAQSPHVQSDRNLTYPTVTNPTVEESSCSDSDEPNEATSPRYHHDSPEYQMAGHLAVCIHDNNPNGKRPSEAQLQQWANDVRLMVERDGRTLGDISALIAWCQADSFWLRNILSMGKLRKQYDRLTLEMRAPARASPKHDGARRDGVYRGDELMLQIKAERAEKGLSR